MEKTEEIIEESFKNRVVECAINCAVIYKENFVEYDYLVCSEAFDGSYYQEIKAEADNYLHLIGVNTNLSSKEFFQKCINKKLEESDFDFKKQNQSEKSVKGSVRQKIKALPKMLKMFEKELLAEKNFKKNSISCLFATADADFTIGLVETGRPKSLMRNNQLNKNRQRPVELVMRKKRGEQFYTERIVGDIAAFDKYKENIKEYVKSNSADSVSPQQEIAATTDQSTTDQALSDQD